MKPELALADFGFSELESRLYCELLRSAPATGYRLAQLIGKAPANVYQALAAMTRKGVVLVEEGEVKTYRALPPSDLMGELAHEFEKRRGSALSALDGVYTRPERDHIYQLHSPAQVLERAQAMIAGAREIVIFDLFPKPFSLLKDSLQAISDRGVRVAGVVYGERPQVGFTCILSAGNPLRERWPGDQITVIADAEAYLMALLSDDGDRVFHGVWSESRYLACLEHSGLSSEIRLAALDLADDPCSYVGLLRAMPSGLRELMAETAARRETAPAPTPQK